MGWKPIRMRSGEWEGEEGYRLGSGSQESLRRESLKLSRRKELPTGESRKEMGGYRGTTTGERA